MSNDSAAQVNKRLEGRSQTECAVVAVRAALHAVPFLGAAKERPRDLGIFVLSSARCLLTLNASLAVQDIDIQRTVWEIHLAMFSVLSQENPSPKLGNLMSEKFDGVAVRGALIEAVGAVAGPSQTAHQKSGLTVGYLRLMAQKTFDQTAMRDVVLAALHDVDAAASESAAGVIEIPLWPDNVMSDPRASAFFDPQRVFGVEPNWAFWREWYQGILDGKPLGWELQRRVALIPDPFWDAGPEAVAEEIERIRAAYEVETRAAELEQSAYSQSKIQFARGVGDNNPPSPIDDALNTSDGATVVWAAAQKLKNEAQSEEPDKDRVKNALSAIVGVMKACGLWAAKKVDKGLNAAIVSACTTVGATGGLWVTQNADKINELIEAVQKWLPFLP